MKIRAIIATAFLVATWPVSPPAFAGDKAEATVNEADVYDPLARQELAHTRKLLQEHRKAMISFDVGLTDEEEKKFWPVYDSYRRAILKANDEYVRVIVEFSKAQKSGKLTDKKALELAKRALRLRQERVGIKKDFIKEFSKVLPGKKVARFYQVDHRLDIADDIEIADTVPLAR